MRSIDGKIVTTDEAAAFVAAAQAALEVVVMCHGCFDLLHRGHLHHLRQARRFGDRLLVTVTGDAFVGKGPGRPLVPEERRARALAELPEVDWVAVNPQATAVELLALVKPDVYVKGREYEQGGDRRYLAERAVVEGYGGRAVFTAGDVVASSTTIIEAMAAGKSIAAETSTERRDH